LIPADDRLMKVFRKRKDQKMTREGACNPIWVFAEQAEGQIQDVSLQLVGKARELARALNTTVEVILLGCGMKDQVQFLFAAGADRIYLGDAPVLKWYEPEIYTQMIVSLAEEKKPEIMLIGSTCTGRELAPMVAARLKTGLTAHCIDLLINETRILEQWIPAYGGLISIICPKNRPQMATVARGVFPRPTMDENRHGDVVMLDIPTNIPGRIQTLQVVRREPETVPLESAAIVVAGGVGAGNEEGWRQIAALARALHAALGCTRPVVDEGWAGHETMIGQSGKMVSPELYIGIGLSGELQHLIGVVSAKVMVAVNKDARSPVFEQVDYGIVEDCRTFVPLLIEKINVYRSRQAGA
jgi:electron transfer flavoprotein alpha subunit